MIEFDFDDVSYLYIENRDEKTIIKLQRDYEWSVEYISGPDIYLGTLFSNMELDDIVESLNRDYDIVEIIDEHEIVEY